MLRLPPQIKLYAEIAAVIGFALLIVWFTHKQRDIGRQQIEAANAKAEAAALIHKSEVEALARMRAGVLANEIVQARIAPPPADALDVRVCPRQGPRIAGDLPANASSGPSSHGEGRLPPAVAEGRNIGPETEQLLEQANAKVRALQGYIKACQEAGICEK